MEVISLINVWERQFQGYVTMSWVWGLFAHLSIQMEMNWLERASLFPWLFCFFGSNLNVNASPRDLQPHEAWNRCLSKELSSHAATMPACLCMRCSFLLSRRLSDHQTHVTIAKCLSQAYMYHVCMYVCVYICIYCICVCMYVFMHVCVHA